MTHPAKKKIIILGGSGFIGAALTTHFRTQRKWEVKNLTSSDMNLTAEENVPRLAKMLDPETIFLFASQAHHLMNPQKVFFHDTLMITHAAQALSKKQTRHCIYFSSTSIFGFDTNHTSVTEETFAAPTSYYGTAKFMGECILKQAALKAGTPFTILRPCMVYGPGDTSEAYGPARFIRSILKDGKVSLFGDGSEVRDYLFIEDLAKMVAGVVGEGILGTYNLATGQSYSFQKIVESLKQISGKKFEISQIKRSQPKIDQRYQISKLLKVMPNLCFTNFDEGLAKTYDYFFARS